MIFLLPIQCLSLISTVQTLSVGLDTVGPPSSQTSFSFTPQNWDDLPPTSLAPHPTFFLPFQLWVFPNRVFYLYSLSIYHLLWVRNQFYKFQWNAHHQIPVWWAVLTRSACRWFLMPISTHTASHLTAATVSPMGTWSVASASFQTYQVQGQAHEFSLQPASLHCYLSWWFG